MPPSFMRHKKRTVELDEDIAAVLMDQIEEGPAKPWTIVSRASTQLEQDPDQVRETLRQLTLHGEVTPTVDGDLRKDFVES